MWPNHGIATIKGVLWGALFADTFFLARQFHTQIVKLRKSSHHLIEPRLE